VLDPTHPVRPRDSAKSVLLSVLGEIVLPSGGQVWGGALVGSLGELGFTESNARQAATRLAADGIMVSSRHGRRIRWDITESGRELLRSGGERIYQFGQGNKNWDGHWLVVLCHVPEAQREVRRLLHRQLSFIGFGFMSPSFAVSPHLDLEPEVFGILNRLGLGEDSAVFRAESGELTSDESVVERSWDLDGLANSYQEFVNEFRAMDPRCPKDSFRALVGLVHSWRQFPFVDPELPLELLPAGWVGNSARSLFTQCRSRWSNQAASYFQGLEALHSQT